MLQGRFCKSISNDLKNHMWLQYYFGINSEYRIPLGNLIVFDY